MHFNLLTLFPSMFPGFLGESLAGRALAESKWSLQATDIRMHAHDKHKTVDDTPFGGGAGMVMRADVLENALLSIPAEKRGVVLYPSPRGPRLTQNRATALAAEPAITFVCGRYEGVDQRFLDAHNIQEISIGDYVLSGGEPAALVIMDAIIRLLPGVMGNDETVAEESFTGLLADMVEYPHYTRPSLWRDAHGVDRPVPPVLQSGDHAKIRSWRMAQAQDLTQKRRDTI